MATRRQFIQRTLGASAAISIAGTMPEILLAASRDSAHPNQLENILVVVQMSGGNDGLNTVIPFGDDEYYKNRFTLAIGKNQVRKINDHVGLHPSLSAYHELLEAGQLAIIQGVGYKNPNRSHFESMDLWHTAHRVEEAKLGWLGRTIDSGQWPIQVPALHLGAEVQPLALRNQGQPVPSVRSIDNFKLNSLPNPRLRKTIKQLIAAPRPGANELLSYVHENANVAIETSTKLEAITDRKQGQGAFPGSRLGNSLKAIAQLIGSGLKTRIYYCTIDGFDTHSNQLQAHAGLLNDLNDSVQAFMKEIAQQGNQDRVSVLSFSEFGRRVRENASRGTDHGTAAPVFLFGNKVKSGLLGKHPSLTDLDEGDLKYEIDYRQVYAAILENWLGVSADQIVGKQYRPVSVFKN